MSELRVIPYSVQTAEENMETDKKLFLEGTPTLRFYGWEPSALSFGKYNQKREEIDFDYCNSQGIDQVVRMTGGKTVYHHHELTYSVVLPTSYFPLGVLDTYKKISEVLMEALATFGLKCEMTPDKTTSDSSVCFREISSYEIKYEGRKLIGSAQHKNSKSVLQHGSILYDIDSERWCKIWKSRLSPENISSRVTSLGRILPNPPNKEDLCNRIEDSFRRHFNF